MVISRAARWITPGVAVVAMAASALAAGPAAAAGPVTWYVNAGTGTDSSSCGTSASSACKSIGQAVTNAAAGDVVRVSGGTYAEQVTVSKRLTILGPGTGRNASGRAAVTPPSTAANGFLITGRGAAGSIVAGFWVHGAQGEGILAMNTSRVTITGNRVEGNDRGATNPSTTYPECQAQGPIPGDCGEGIHLWSTSGSRVVWNEVFDNTGGILLTDETGPSAHNLVARNVVFDNADDCGITVVSHNNKAFANGRLAPTVGGVFANVVTANTVDDNGLVGQGAGIILAGAGPGTAVYRNVVSDNVARHNGLGGVTLHDHAPGQFMDGNAIIGNYFDGNDTTGGPNNTPGDQDTAGPNGQGGLTRTADVIVFSAVDLVKFTVISGNTFANAHFGIWTHNAPSLVSRNHYLSSVAVHVLQSPAPVRTTITGPRTAAVGKKITLSGKAEPSVTVVVQTRAPSRPWRVLVRTTSSSTGSWSVQVTKQFATQDFRATAYASRTGTLRIRA
jgi:parallel beta-helix repeat protein